MNNHSKNPIRVAAATLALAAALTTGAHAGDLPQIRVKYADLNVDTRAGATHLYRRIRFAADQVCGVADIRELARIEPAKTCAARAVGEAVAAVNAPALTGVYDVNKGRTPVVWLAAGR